MTIGSALPRVDGSVKVTGKARYSTDNSPRNMLHASLVGAPIAAGKLISIDASAAMAIPGVVRVLTKADMPKFGALKGNAAVKNLPLQTDDIRYEGETVAIVLAETIEAADAARQAVRVNCSREPALVVGRGRPDSPPPKYPVGEDTTIGDIAGGLAKAVYKIEQSYTQPQRHHNAMETSGTVAMFEGDKLTMWDSVQRGANVPPVVASALGLNPEDIRIIAPYTGGGFGSKTGIHPHQILVAAAAKISGRPVKLHLTRADQYCGTGHQAWMGNKMTLGADAQGRLTVIRHHAVNSTAIAETFFEGISEPSKTVYACPAIETRQMLERVNSNLPSPMRSPMEGCGLWALESAMDELATAIGMDPLDLRLVNYAERDPHTGKPWSSKKLREAYAEGARLYGWRTRHERPKQDGNWTIGHGMATASMGCIRYPGGARVRLKADGTAVIETDTHDIGTGTLTIFTQIAADELGISTDRVSLRWGDTELPLTGSVSGSSATMHTGSAIAGACREIKTKLKRFGEGHDMVQTMRDAGISEIAGEGTFSTPNNTPFNIDGLDTPWAMRTFGAIFVEVGVDRDLGLVRFRRAVGAYSAGRVINPTTARSQITGGMIWGWGKAIMEQSVQEPNHARWLAKNLSNVAVPVNADIPSDLKVHFVEEYDEHASLIGAKGVGELGSTGIDAAIASAIHDAIGIRFRELPITPAKIISALSGGLA